MSSKIQIKRRNGSVSSAPSLAEGELAFDMTNNALYIGGSGGNNNIKIADVSVFSDIQTLTSTVGTKLTANKAAAQATLDTSAELADVITAFNSLITAMKDSGLMNT